MKDVEMLFQDPSLISNAAHLKQRGHAEPTCRVGDLLRRHDPLSAKEHCPQPGQAPKLFEAVRSCSDFGRSGRSGSVPVRLRFGYGLIHRYSSEAAGCVSRTSWASWASWASSVPGPIDPRGEWRSLAQNGMQKYAEMKHNGTQMNTGTKWIKMDQNATNEARYISLPYFRCPTFRAKAGCFQSKESGKYCVLLRKAAAYLVTNKGNIQVGALHGLALQLLPMLSLIMFWFVLICLFLVILCHFVCYLTCLWCVFVDFVVQVKNGSVVQMGDILATEPMPVPRTSDIVQGLPRIDRLFEARTWVSCRQKHQTRIKPYNI